MLGMNFPVGTRVRNIAAITVNYGPGTPMTVIPAHMEGVVEYLVEETPEVVGVRWRAQNVVAEVGMAILNATNDCTYGVMRVKTPACQTVVFCAWARKDGTEQVVFTRMCPTYTAAKTELQEEIDARGWNLRWFDGEVEVG